MAIPVDYSMLNMCEKPVMSKSSFTVGTRFFITSVVLLALAVFKSITNARNPVLLIYSIRWQSMHILPFFNTRRGSTAFMNSGAVCVSTLPDTATSK